MTRLVPVTQLFAPLLAGLRRRHLIPVLAAVLAAIIALPFVLGHNTSARSVALRPLPASPSHAARSAAAAKAPAVRRHAERHRTGGHSALLRGARIKTSRAASTKHAARTASTAGPRTHAAGATTSSPRPSASTAAASPVTGGAAVAGTRTVTVTVPAATPAPPVRPVFTSYAAALAFGPAGAPAQRLTSAPRDVVLPSMSQVAVIYLGILGDGRTAEFLVSNRVQPSGDGSCFPSATQCTFMTLQPGQHESLLLANADGTTSPFVLRYAAARVAHTPAKPHPAVSASGQQLVAEVAKLLPSLRTLHYDAGTGLLTLPAGAGRISGGASAGEAWQQR